MDVTTPNDREILIKRAFDAPRDLVFRANTVPQLVQRWLLGPDGWTMPVCKIDLRVGGSFEYRWRDASGSQEFGISGEFQEIAAPERLVHVERMEGMDGKSIVTTLFEAVGTKTIMTLTMLFDSKEQRDGALASGMADGMTTTYDRLETMLAMNLETN
jgi:uncharacterized protein YndB with AHSA1/START domain